MKGCKSTKNRTQEQRDALGVRSTLGGEEWKRDQNLGLGTSHSKGITERVSGH